MNIREKEDALFDEWRSGWTRNAQDQFVSDGVINESAYHKAKRRVMLVLKEANQFSGDLRSLLSDKPDSATWNNVTRWIIGIQDLDKDIPWSKIEEIDIEQRRSDIKSLCLLNLRKLPGDSTANPDDLKSFLDNQQNRAFLKRQFYLYKPRPDIVICGGTGDLFRQVVKETTVPAWKQTSKGIRYFEVETGEKVVSFFHPQARYPAYLMHYALMDAVRELLGL